MVTFLQLTLLQIALEKPCREWITFHFEGQVCQVARLPHGFRTALAGFI
jgi:hypothetical protein